MLHSTITNKYCSRHSSYGCRRRPALARTPRQHIIQTATSTSTETYCFDLDTAVCDTSAITITSARSAAQQLWPNRSLAPTDTLLAKARMVLPVVAQAEHAVFLIRLIQDELIDVHDLGSEGHWYLHAGKSDRAQGKRRTRPFRPTEISEHWQEILPACVLRWSLEQGITKDQLLDRAKQAFSTAQLQLAPTATAAASAAAAAATATAADADMASTSGRSIVDDVKVFPTVLEAVKGCDKRVVVVSCLPQSLAEAVMGHCGLAVQPGTAISYVTAPSWQDGIARALQLHRHQGLGGGGEENPAPWGSGASTTTGGSSTGSSSTGGLSTGNAPSNSNLGVTAHSSTYKSMPAQTTSPSPAPSAAPTPTAASGMTAAYLNLATAIKNISNTSSTSTSPVSATNTNSTITTTTTINAWSSNSSGSSNNSNSSTGNSSSSNRSSTDNTSGTSSNSSSSSSSLTDTDPLQGSVCHIITGNLGRAELLSQEGLPRCQLHLAEWGGTSMSMRARALSLPDVRLLGDHELAEMLQCTHLRLVMDGIAW